MRISSTGFFLVLVAGCSGGGGQHGADAIDVKGLAAAVEVLSSDEFEGRGPSSAGEEKTVAYVSSEFARVGLEPGNGESYTQDVPLVSMTVTGAPSLEVSVGRTKKTYAYGSQQVVWTKRVVESIDVSESQLVFVGYGIVAPEAGWDDYQGVDMRGKTAVILVNDPGFATKDPAVFQGEPMTYYGRWTYKYEEAARQGAEAALIVHDTEPAAYPWAVVENSWTGPQFDLVTDDGNADRVAVEGWLTLEVAREIFDAAGKSLDELTQQAATGDLKPVPMNARISVGLNNDLERSTSRNIVGVLPGSERPDEYVIYMAHWDHLGIDPALEGDPIYNGALDNATGVAGLVELGEAFATSGKRPARSVMMFAPAAEEFGLLGSAYYAHAPLVPSSKTVAAINMDGLNVLGPMRDITVTGYGASELDDYLERAASEVGRAVVPDPEPQKGYYYRSDHFNFAKAGIPALYPDVGTDHVEHGKEWTQQQKDAYVANDYHKPSDEMRDDWDLSGAVDDLRLLFTVGYRIADSTDWPNWREGNEFRAIRDADLAGGSR